MFYEFRQNNSGGFWREPGMSVIIEANSSEEANVIAETKGLYFNGCEEGLDCDCCGDRWYRAWSDKDGEESFTTPERGEIYEEWAKRDSVKQYVIYFKDGSEKSY